MIDNGNLLVDDVYHKTFIAVDEPRAAATAIVVGETSAPMEEFFRADRLHRNPRQGHRGESLAMRPAPENSSLKQFYFTNAIYPNLN